MFSLTITFKSLVPRLWVIVKVVLVLFPIVSSYKTLWLSVASEAATNLVPLNLRTWFNEAPVGSISIESTVNVVAWILPTLTVDGSESV